MRDDSAPALAGAVWWRCGHRPWDTLTTALTNPGVIDAWHQCDKDQRRRREEQRNASARGRPNGWRRTASGWARPPS